MSQPANGPYGRIAYEANKLAWPPGEAYVEWEKLTQTARDGWDKVAWAAIYAWKDNNK